MQSETEALIEQDLDPPSPEAQSSTKHCALMTDHLDPGNSFPRGTVPRSCSKNSVRSLRRASSLDDIEGMRAEGSSAPRDPHTNSSEYLSGTLRVSQWEFVVKKNSCSICRLLFMHVFLQEAKIYLQCKFSFILVKYDFFSKLTGIEHNNSKSVDTKHDIILMF